MKDKFQTAMGWCAAFAVIGGATAVVGNGALSFFDSRVASVVASSNSATVTDEVAVGQPSSTMQKAGKLLYNLLK